MKKKQQVIVILLIICVLIIGLLIGTLIYVKKKNSEEMSEQLSNERNEYLYDQENAAKINNGKKPSKVTITNLYYTVDKCIKSYFSILESNDPQVIMSYLDKDYIEEKNITDKNLFENISKYDNNSSYRTSEIYELSGIQYAEYYVKGKVDNQEVFFKVGVDMSNSTFDIMPIDRSTYENKISEEFYTDESDEKVIEKKTYNIISFVTLDDESTARLYFADYFKVMLTDSKEAYNMLQEEYKNTKFEKFDKFYKYIEDNRENMELTYKVETMESNDFKNFSEYYSFKQQNSNLGVKSYSVKEYDGYTQYICADIYENYYIFNVTNPGEYKVLLDAYTIDLPVFTDSYNKAKNENKVALNIKKIKCAINTKDYEYVYKKLDDTFKKNNFDTLEKFEQYMEKQFFEINSFECSEITEQNDVYAAVIVVKDAQVSQTNSKNLNIIMKLKEGTDFVMSFSME